MSAYGGAPTPQTTTSQHVAMGAIGVAVPPGRLEIRGLGSCVAVALFDPVAKVAGLAHAVIPRRLNREMPGPAWAASEAVDNLVEAMRRRGARRERLVAYLAGGASMFASVRRVFNVGEENARSAMEALASLDIPLARESVGGTRSRRVSIDADTGTFQSGYSPSREVLAPEPLPPPQGVDSERELAHVILHRAVAPLSTLLSRPISVTSPTATELTSAEMRTFLGGVGVRLLWAVVPLAWDDREATLVLIVPQAHADALVAAVERAVGVKAEAEDVVSEVVNVVVGHAATALSRVFRARVVPGIAEVDAGTASGAGARLRRIASTALVIHGRVHATALLHGMDLALALLEVPAPGHASLAPERSIK